jgi:hypothetical protein
MRKTPQYENKWELWHTVPDNGTFQLTCWDAPIPTIRKILKKIRADYPIYEFRSKISQSPYSAGVKYIEVRRKIPWDLKYLDNYHD